MAPVSRFVILFFGGMVAFNSGAWARPDSQEVAKVLHGVSPFRLDRLVPGVLRLDPLSARPLLLDDQRGIFAAVGTSSGGRMVAFAHDGFLAPERFGDEAAVRQLLLNSLRWAGVAEAPAVGIDPSFRPLEPMLRAIGLDASVVAPADLVRQVDVYCWDGQRPLPPEAIDRLRKFLLKGGGLIVVATPWAFESKFPNFADLPANQLGKLAGIEFLSQGVVQVREFVATRPVSAGEVMAAARSLMSPVAPPNLPELVDQFRAVLRLDSSEAIEVLPAVAALDDAIGPVIPSVSDPLHVGTDLLKRAVVEVRSGLNLTLPPAALPALPAAVDFPGAVPGEAPRVTRSFPVDGTWRGWATGRNAGAWSAGELRSTGLYAAPGEVIEISIPEECTGYGFELVIGSYQGGLQNRKEWHRYPQTQRSFGLDAVRCEAANGLGGLVLIRVPRGAKAGTVEVGVAGAVEAPWFRLGETTVDEWRRRIRSLPGPWAELEGRRIILTVPSVSIRGLEDPESILRCWDEMLDRAAGLAALDREGFRKERLIFDRQTSAGSLHSGYPVAAHLGPDLAVALDPHRLKGEGSWGFFHEIGHNHQHDLWALPGTTETTCNLWSVYLFEEWTGRSRDGAHPEVHPLRRRQLRQAYFQGERDFAAGWNVFTALDCYLLVQEGFGWKPFQEVFAEFHRLPEADWPRTQQEKNDQWGLRLSRACGANLAPYYRRWNLPISDSVQKELSGLPGWMPELPE